MSAVLPPFRSIYLRAASIVCWAYRSVTRAEHPRGGELASLGARVFGSPSAGSWRARVSSRPWTRTARAGSQEAPYLRPISGEPAAGRDRLRINRKGARGARAGKSRGILTPLCPPRPCGLSSVGFETASGACGFAGVPPSLSPAIGGGFTWLQGGASVMAGSSGAAPCCS